MRTCCWMVGVFQNETAENEKRFRRTKHAIGRFAATAAALLVVSACFAAVGASAWCAEPDQIKYRKLVLSDQFFSEGAYYGDFNRDGKLDIVSGPFWFEGPDFQKKHVIYEPKAYDPKSYSENFLVYSADFNADGWTDIVIMPHPGRECFWFENPKGQEAMWTKHLADPNVGNESPMWGDVTGDKQPDLIFNRDGFLGYSVFDTAQPGQPWKFQAVSPQNKRYHKYTHGVGYGDIDGDGRVDLVESIGWWKQPEKVAPSTPWAFHPFKFADAAAQMLVYDVDGDGRNDVITSWHCHLYGLVWYRQISKADGSIDWEQHEILPIKPDLNSSQLRVSQLHAFDVADFNGDGLTDFVTGKRFWAHGPKGDVEPDAPAVVVWFELKRDAQKGAKFIPHLIDDDSGVGTQVTAVDLNGDQIPDVVVGNKKGIFVHLSVR